MAPPPRRSPVLRLALALAGATLAACVGTHAPLEEAPAPEVAAAYFQGAAEGGAAQASAGPWWRDFGDADLSGLVEEALASSHELDRLAARITQARALLRQAQARGKPTVDAGAELTGRRTQSVDDGAVDRSRGSALGADVRLELDLFGRLDAARRAQAREAAATVEDWRAGRLFLSAAVAATYFEVVEERLQLRLLAEQLAVNETLLDLTRLRFGQGQSSIVDVLQQQEQLAATRSRVPAIEARMEELELVLDVLLGRAPGMRPRLAGGALRPPPPPPALGAPAELRRMRPDVRAAANRVLALDHRIAEAMAARLPQLELGGSLDIVGDLAPQSWIAGVFAAITGPLFDSGLRAAEVERRRAVLEEAVAQFAILYLDAVREVETAMVQERTRADRLRRLEDQLATANRLLAETRNRYRQGLTDYLPVLSAVVTTQNLERTVLTSRRELLSARVALYRALGGPMDTPPTPPAPGEDE